MLSALPVDFKGLNGRNGPLAEAELLLKRVLAIREAALCGRFENSSVMC
jgi:hypothetical protein